MRPWIVSIPCWGQRYIDTLLSGPLDSILVALKRPATFMFHTAGDRSWIPLAMLYDAGHTVEVREMGGPEKYSAFGNAHREALDFAEPEDYVALLSADMTVSRETFSACERQFARGKWLVIAPATSTLPPSPDPGMSSKALLEWALAHLHPIHQETIWGVGHSLSPATLMFKHERGVDLHGFHMHPVAVKKYAGLTFLAPTADEKLPAQFPEHQIHLVTGHDELAVVETSPPDRPVFKNGPITAEGVANWARQCASERHRWMFKQCVNLSGQPSDHKEIVNKILGLAA